MTIDSATAANVSTIASINPSTGFVVLVLCGGLLYLLSLLLKNTAITKAIADKLDSNDDIAKIVKEIREDQKVSNAERRELNIRVTAIEGRMDRMERACMARTSACLQQNKQDDNNKPRWAASSSVQ